MKPYLHYNLSCVIGWYRRGWSTTQMTVSRWSEMKMRITHRLQLTLSTLLLMQARLFSVTRASIHRYAPPNFPFLSPHTPNQPPLQPHPRPSNQGRNHVFKVRGPIPWSGVLLPFYRKIRQVYPVWCSRLHSHTLFIKKLCKKLGVCPNFGEIRTPSGCVFASNPRPYIRTLY